MEIPKITGDFDNEIQEALNGVHKESKTSNWLTLRNALKNAGYIFSKEEITQMIRNHFMDSAQQIGAVSKTDQGRLMAEIASTYEVLGFINWVESAFREKDINKMVSGLQHAGHNVKHPQHISPMPLSEGPVFS